MHAQRSSFGYAAGGSAVNGLEYVGIFSSGKILDGEKLKAMVAEPVEDGSGTQRNEEGPSVVFDLLMHRTFADVSLESQTGVDAPVRSGEVSEGSNASLVEDRDEHLQRASQVLSQWSRAASRDEWEAPGWARS